MRDVRAARGHRPKKQINASLFDLLEARGSLLLLAFLACAALVCPAQQALRRKESATVACAPPEVLLVEREVLAADAACTTVHACKA